ncbi:MAG: DUF3781 domain-containing protein, partial [Bacteroidales bacterium]|nr:DUF3781 domain-containing protein [Bacteroidales bacterium]
FPKVQGRGLRLVPSCTITRNGKNFYCDIDGIIITVNAHSFTIITAHKK